MSFDSLEDAVEVGDEGARITVEDISRATFVRYAGASGDFNPLHYNDEYVRNAGYDGVFGQGMFVAGIVSRVVTQWFGIEGVSTFDIRFTEKVLPGETIHAFGVVEEVQETPDATTIELALTAETDDGTELATGTATVTFGESSL
ncbi:MaoC/PaaZ C-terminal domain-containing protein [Natronomonas sp. EA1]|uniref:MaoC/PaaZ C-terminal domain-containing protein n=1 Tax=Natronomonas sp. EA1 TaxID=3421655 RepID=UPI003EB9DCC3